MGRNVVLHPLSTSNHNGNVYAYLWYLLYCILFLHQTTTTAAPVPSASSCIASSFYIKPQQAHATLVADVSCIASSFYIKPQQIHEDYDGFVVVLHPLSTSNHNFSRVDTFNFLLYCILFLHQTTTKPAAILICFSCIASSFYIKPQPSKKRMPPRPGCIASSFYIKPQPRTPDTLIFGHLTASRHDTKRGGVHRGSRFDAVFTFSTNIRKIIFTEIRRCMSVQRAGARLRSDSSEANI